MKKNRSRICGKNTNTLPRPLKMPCVRKSRKMPAGSQAVMPLRSHANASSISEMAGSDQENSDWNTTSITNMNSANPQTGCNSTRSARSESRRLRGWRSCLLYSSGRRASMYA
jgi:hypothetical protein